MNFKNIKIEINQEQQLDEVVRELESKGWLKRVGAHFGDEIGSYLIATSYGIITWCYSHLVDVLWPNHKATTLDELKEMK